MLATILAAGEILSAKREQKRVVYSSLSNIFYVAGTLTGKVFVGKEQVASFVVDSEGTLELREKTANAPFTGILGVNNQVILYWKNEQPIESHLISEYEYDRP